MAKFSLRCGQVANTHAARLSGQPYNSKIGTVELSIGPEFLRSRR